MADRPANHSEPTQAAGQGQSLREDLRREHELVRSTGTISKSVMALAFGVVLLLVAVLVAAPFGQWVWAWSLGAIGATSVAWAVLAWVHRSRKPTR